MINKLQIKKMKKIYEELSWIYVKDNKKVPRPYNDVLDLIEVIENGVE